MEKSKENLKLSKTAIEYIKQLDKNKELYKIGIGRIKLKPLYKPATFFMAGSPGAGKTEFSKNFIKELIKEKIDPIIRVDADEIRVLCPGYNGSNSEVFQEAAVLGVNKLYDYALKNKFNVLLDGTFSQLTYAISNIERAVRRNREVYILYVYQDPVRAWEFTQKREKIEGRRIELEVFVRDFLAAKNNVNELKEKFLDRVVLNIIKKDYNNGIEKFWANRENVDNYIKFDYTAESLLELLKETSL